MNETCFESLVNSVINLVDTTLTDIAGTQITATSDMTNVLLDIRGYVSKIRELETVDA